MLRKYLFGIGLSLFATSALSIVTRSDVPAENYLVDNAPSYLINMPGEGHGTLIAPNWIITVSHLIFSDYTGREIEVAGNVYSIEKVVLYETPKSPDKQLLEGDAMPLMDFMKASHDIALIKLSSNVENVAPLHLYSKSDEQGLEIEAFGRGSTGNGSEGSVFETKRAKVLRKMQNRIDFVDGNWVSISLSSGIDALSLEGIDGSGDSGGPLITYVSNKPYLVGMFSWDFVEGDLKSFKHGLYGGRSYQVRISQYVDWINNTIRK